MKELPFQFQLRKLDIDSTPGSSCPAKKGR